MKPCPKCGKQVDGKVYGGQAAFGCGEYDFEVECSCGIMYNVGPFDTEQLARENGEKMWDVRTYGGSYIVDHGLMAELADAFGDVLHCINQDNNCDECPYEGYSDCETRVEAAGKAVLAKVKRIMETPK